MDVFFLALESPLFPAALVALFLTLGAQAMKAESITTPDTPRLFRPAPRFATPQHDAALARNEPADLTLSTSDIAPAEHSPSI